MDCAPRSVWHLVLNSVSFDTYRRLETELGPTRATGPETYGTLY